MDSPRSSPHWICAAALLAALWLGVPPLTRAAGGEPAASAAPHSTICPAAALCFFAVGDTGTGEPPQREVAAAIAAKCRAAGCRFGLLLGDVIYEHGVTSPADPQFAAKLERPYAGLAAPFYAVLGNHDYDGTTWSQGDHYLAYAGGHPNFLMPGLSYAFEAGPALFLALDTQPLIRGHGRAEREQGALVDEALLRSRLPWRIAFGHHPYVSNGVHGTAGRYDHCLVPIGALCGGRLKRFTEAHLCGKVDLYLSGHDHSRQVLQDVVSCPGTTFVVSGAGAKVSELPGTHPARFQQASLGFAYVRVTVDALDLEMLDASGAVQFRLELNRPAR
jgi:hypothetical protein